MGNQQSAEKERSSSSRTGTPQEPQKKHSRRHSVQPLPVSHGRGSPADPSASTANAVAQPTSQPHGRQPLLQYLPSPSPEDLIKNKLDRSISRASKEKKNEVEYLPKEQQLVAVPHSDPMNVPATRSKQDDFDEKPFDKQAFGDGLNGYLERRYTSVAAMRPPRLPLPIADAVINMPDSPGLPPVDKGDADVPVFETDDPLSPISAHLRRKSSMLSTTTQDDEDVGEELPAVDPTSQTAPTLIEWNSPGHKVYVTGTFANWERKFKLHHNKSSSGLFVTLNLPPGTHHLMFLVDEKMITSPDLPTCVDFNNVLVNYIELATEDVMKPRRESNQTVTKEMAMPSHPPQVAEEQEGQQDGEEPHPDVDELEPQPEEIAQGDFRQIIPQALLDIDLPEDDSRYHQATNVIGDCQGPPSLPMFLSRSILNGNLSVKDDSSVLALPNHTVLNHLMTSSVKNGVLATSVTTRYKKKYVTTISFKPVPKMQT